MKRKDLIKQITSIGCVLQRLGQRHDLYINPKIGKKQPVPRHGGSCVDKIHDQIYSRVNI
jgi:predicted RNA binding protein YcfA (HicA-like mRNA interferase family)